MRLDLDSLSRSDWKILEALEAAPLDPNNTPWPEGTLLLVKLVIRGGWGLWLSQADLREDDPR